MLSSCPPAPPAHTQDWGLAVPHFSRASAQPRAAGLSLQPVLARVMTCGLLQGICPFCPDSQDLEERM